MLSSLQQIDLLTIGDSSIDLFMKVPSNATGIEEALNQETPKMCFFHGSKIMVESFQTFVAGNAINVGVGAQLLGLSTAVYTEVGDDSNADRIISELGQRNVVTKFVKKNKNTETALHTVIVYAGERTIFSYHGKHDYKIHDWGNPKYIYYTSLGEGFESFQQELIEYKHKNPEVGLIFNPGTYQMSVGSEKLKNILEICDILILNKEEAQKLTQEPGRQNSLEELHKKLFSICPKLCVITDGKNGASAFDGNALHHTDAYSDERAVIDKTGAGDAFSAGFVSAIYYGKNLDEALRWGVINSGCQIKVIGSINGMLTKPELQKNYESIKTFRKS